MNALSIPMVAMAGISLYVGFYHLLIYFRHRQSRADLMFALLCFAYVFYAVFCAGLYNATSVAEGAEWQRVQLIALAVFATAFLWFVADYTHQKPGTPIYLFSIFYLVAVIVQSVDRSELTFLVDQPSIKYVILPHIQPITYYEATFGPFTTVQSIMGVVASTYILIMGVRYFKRGYKREAIPLILAIILMSAAGLHDMLVSNGIYHFIYLMEYAYLAVILLMANSLSNIVVEAAIAKEELRRSEERLRALVETTSDWVWEVDANGVYTYASPKIRDLLGYEPEEVIGRTPFDLMPEEEAQRVRIIFQNIVSQKKSVENLENIARGKDEQLIVLETNGIPFFDDYGRLQGYRGIDRDITERKRAEQALQAKTEELDRYFTSSLDLLCIADTDGYFRRLNPAWETTLGYAIAELEGRQFLEFVHPEDIEATRATVSRLAGQEQILNFENRYRCKDGSYRWIEWRSFPIEKMIYAVARDITERKQVEEALRESEQELRASEERYRTLVEVSPIGTWISKNQVITYANPAALKIFGATDLSEIVGRTSFDFIHPDYHAVARERIAQMMETGKIVPLLEEKYVRLDGNVVDVEVIATPLITSEGSIIQVFFQDITKRKQAEQALRESEERLRQIASSLRETIWLRDVQTRQVLYVNPAFEQLTGWTCESFYENPNIVIDAIHPDDKEWVIRALARRFERVSYNEEHRIIHRDGSVRWVSSRSFPVRNEAGEVFRWASIMEDITERKQAETERERLIVELENRNAELERFTYTVSHDLKTPLITIRGFLGYIEQDALSGDMNRLKDDLQRIVAATDKMQRLLNELLDLSRIGRIMNPPGKIAFGELVQEAIKLLEGQLQERNIEVKIQEDLPVVFGDSQRLLEVIQNLLDNAVKFMGTQSASIIEIGTLDEENESPVFYVRDNGIGIAPEHHERIFGLFNKLNPRAEGTGVGLAIVKRIIEVHGGRIWVESEAGKGATFYFTLGKGPQDHGIL